MDRRRPVLVSSNSNADAGAAASARQKKASRAARRTTCGRRSAARKSRTAENNLIAQFRGRYGNRNPLSYNTGRHRSTAMRVSILDDYHDTLRTLQAFRKLD